MITISEEEYKTLREASAELAYIKGFLKSFIDVRLAGYTDKQYGKGELRALIGDDSGDKKRG